MSSLSIRLPLPHPGQISVRNQARRLNVLCAGRRWRKTTLCMSIAVEEALRGATVLWGAPVYDQARVCMDETRRAARGVATFNESRMTAEFPTGGSIVYRSLDKPDNARSHTADGMVIDEAADVDPVAWHEVLRPMLIDTNGWAWLIGTPRGKNWYWQEYLKARDGANSAAFQAPTLGVAITPEGLRRSPSALENPHIPFDEIRQLYEGMPERSFRQEILAEFVESGGGVFRNVRACASGAINTGPLEGKAYVAGLDWALSTDFTVLTIINVTDKRVVYIDRFNGAEYALQRERIKAACDRFGVRVLIAEENAMGKPNNDELRRMGVKVRDFTTTTTTKADIIESLAAAFEHGRIGLPDYAPLVDELEAYESERLPSGAVRYTAPQGMHDDTVMSLALAWQGVVSPTKTIRSFQG